MKLKNFNFINYYKNFVKENLIKVEMLEFEYAIQIRDRIKELKENEKKLTEI